MTYLREDIRYSMRALRQRPGLCAVVVLTLALGIGANTALFSVIKAMLIEPLPYRDPDSVAMIWSQWTAFEKTWVSIPEYHQYRSQLRSFDDIALFQKFEANITDGDAERVTVSIITPNMLRVLGVTPVLGRDFLDEDGVQGQSDVVLLSHGLWQARYAGDAGAVGRAISVNGESMTVVGVLPLGFKLPLDFAGDGSSQLLAPLVLPPDTGEIPHAGGSHSYFAVGRLAPGIGAAAANAELDAHVQRLADEGVYGHDMRFSAFAVTATDEVVGTLRPALWVLMGAVVLVLLIACANVTNLLLVSGEDRRREMGVRSALGADRTRLVRQLLTEGLVLTGIGTVLGVWLAWFGVRVLTATAPADLPRLADSTIDPGVLVFTAAVAVVAAILASLVPALHGTRLNLSESLNAAGRANTTARSGQSTRRGIVVATVALSIVLVAGAGLTMRSYWNLVRIDPGFDSSQVLTMRLSANTAFYPDDVSVGAFYDGLLGRVRAMPGVEHAGLVRLLPIDTEMGDTCVIVEGYEPPPHQCAASDWQAASPGYFEAMGIPLAEGRLLNDADDRDTSLAVVVNEEFVRRYIPDGSAIGKRVRFAFRDGLPWQTIVGVVGDVRHNGITGEVKAAFYRPHAQWAVPSGNPLRTVSLVIRAQGDLDALAAQVREDLRAIDARVPVSRVQTMDEVLGGAVAQPRFTIQLLGGFAALALVLALIGIYGVIAHMVAARRRELGVRIALGARGVDVTRLVMRQGAVLAAAGVALGLAMALLGTRALSGLLYEVGTADPATYAGVVTLALVTALLASWLPARRAANIDPMEALRHE